MMILERRLNENQNTLVFVIDLEKAFFMINWEFLFDCMKNVWIDWKNRILNCFTNINILKMK